MKGHEPCHSLINAFFLYIKQELNNNNALKFSGIPGLLKLVHVKILLTVKSGAPVKYSINTILYSIIVQIL